MDAEKIDAVVRAVAVWGIVGVAVVLAAQKFLF